MSSTDSGAPVPAGGSEGPAVVARRPLVSVCIPTRDRAAWLVEAVRSALGQEVEELEVLVFDDASSDDTAERVEALADPRIRYFRHDEPVGVARNRNACLDAARGLYLAWLDDDDAYLSGGLARQIEVLEREPSVALAHGSIEVIDGEGRPCPPWPAPFGEDTIEPGPDAFGELVLGNYVRAPTAVARASAQRAAGPYPTDLGDRAEDWDAWLRLALEGDIAFSAEPVAVYRCHAGGASARRTSSLAWLQSEARVVRRALERARERARAGFDDLRARAKAALAARGLEAADDAMARGRESIAFRATRWAAGRAPAVAESLLEAAAHARRGDEHRFHIASRPARAWIAEALEGSRLGASLRARLEATDGWSAERARVAGRIRQVVPPGATVAAVDKWDPSLLHEADRPGRHFPDLALAPEGYPADDTGAIDHLRAQRAGGVEYLVIPRASFWWLEHYVRFARHLDRRHDRVWADDACVIFKLAPEAAGEAAWAR